MWRRRWRTTQFGPSWRKGRQPISTSNGICSNFTQRTAGGTIFLNCLNELHLFFKWSRRFCRAVDCETSNERPSISTRVTPQPPLQSNSKVNAAGFVAGGKDVVRRSSDTESETSERGDEAATAPIDELDFQHVTPLLRISDTPCTPWCLTRRRSCSSRRKRK